MTIGTIHFLWVGGRWFLGEESKNFRAKKGGAIPKIEGEGGRAGKCSGLRGHSRENWGVMQNFSDIIQKPPPLPIKTERSRNLRKELFSSPFSPFYFEITSDICFVIGSDSIPIFRISNLNLLEQKCRMHLIQTQNLLP